jgi:hypothetical protein
MKKILILLAVISFNTAIAQKTSDLYYVTMKNGKMMAGFNETQMLLTKNLTSSDGTVYTTDGFYIKTDGTSVKIQEGQSFMTQPLHIQAKPINKEEKPASQPGTLKH